MADNRGDDPIQVDGNGLAAMAEATNRLADELAADRPNIKVVARRQWWQNLVLALVAVVAITSVITSMGNRSIANTLHDCIEPSGQCYQDSRRRSGEIQRSIIESQHADMDRNLRAVCAFVSQHELKLPSECAEVAPVTPPENLPNR